jgi:aryl-alcohol dehydrogenase-like predicted oxidoreductase
MTPKPDSPDRREILKMLAGLIGAACLPVPAAIARTALLKRPIPSSGEMLPSVGLGTSRVFDVGESPDDREPLSEVLKLLTDHGGSVVDTSPMYGRAERVVGDLAHRGGLSDRIFLATKVWTRGREAGATQMEESMRLLRTDTIDLMQIHNLVDWKTHLGTLRGWKEEGRIRYLGITHYRVDAFAALEEIMRTEQIDFVQLNYSILTPAAADRLLPLAADRGIAVLVNRPYENGAVFSRVRGMDLPDWAKELEISSWGQFCLKWVLADPAVTCVIPGTSKPRHMLDNLGAGFGPLPEPAQRERMQQVLAQA